ncbi:carbonic anhydrase [Sphingomonas japonica]|uniref:Carbonic anhydrase n=1 Tax=Sphingomonas japonica TaxID=511662 RepID=A0ABX0TZR5_9SPHN|nr:carbonic anhydrase [Sphingomonas japonica]NIJ22849.1 carbonic anhydrase [Sphingomonas japonica]
MMEILGGVARFQGDVFPQQQALFELLARDGQSPKTLMISCADSRVVPELITQANPGELFVCRNAGNIVPPFSQKNGGVSSAVEYAVMALGVSDIVVCGHSDCGAMKAFFNPDALDTMPNVKAWLAHAEPAWEVVKTCYHELDTNGQVRALSLENVSMQLTHLQNHPSVAAGLAAGKLSLHGWFFEIETGRILALDGESNTFKPIETDKPIPVAMPARKRRVAEPMREVA